MLDHSYLDAKEIFAGGKEWPTSTGSVVAINDILEIIDLGYLFPFDSHAKPYKCYRVLLQYSTESTM